MTGTATAEGLWGTLEEAEMMLPRQQDGQVLGWGLLGVAPHPPVSTSLLGSPGAPCEQGSKRMQTAAKTAVGGKRDDVWQMGQPLELSLEEGRSQGVSVLTEARGKVRGRPVLGVWGLWVCGN